MDLHPRRALALLALLGTALVVPAAQQDPARLEAESKALGESIQRLQRRIQLDEVEKNRQSRELRDAERSVAREQGELTRLRAERAERAAIRRHLEAEKDARVVERGRTVAELGRQLRAAYFMGRNEPLKLLLNQRSPAEFSRNLTYYGYLGRLRADQIRQIGENIAKIEELTAKIEAEDVRLASLETAQQEKLDAVNKARRQRGQILANLQRESRSRTAELERRRQEQKQLERIIESVRREARSFSYDPKAPFVQARGKLSWPVVGRIIVNYNATISGGGKSEGIDIDTERGAPVKAVHEGLVRYADWLGRRGHFVIVDHGNEYWSLYGHLDELYAKPGARIAAGEVIGTAGDSGGRPDTGLWFEIRHNGQPVDPRRWFRTAAPAAR
jgi:murein hydrolase activator